MLYAAAFLALIPGPTKDIVYSKAGGEQLMLDIYAPTSADSAKARPAVLVVHGGAWIMGKRQDMAAVCEMLASHNFVAVTPTYRLAPKHKWPAMLDDVQTAVRFLRAYAGKYGIDPSRIGAAGFSAGGHLVLHLGLRDTRDPNPTEYKEQNSRVKAVLNFFGPTDFNRSFGPNIEMLYPTVLGKAKKDAGPELKDASPVTWVSKDDAPVFTFHGTKDLLVPVEQAEILRQALTDAGVENQVEIIEGGGHDVDQNNPKVVSALSKMVTWLSKKLGF